MSVVRIHFLYGSKPSMSSRKSEKRWFGGILGGHAGLEIPGKGILHFFHKGSFHVFPRRKKLHASFGISDEDRFYAFHGGDPSQMKKLIIEIPIEDRQQQLLESFYNKYVPHPPYDYALLGMRCASAVNEMLASAGILKNTSRTAMILSSFFPRLLRKRLLKEAAKRAWRVFRAEGCETRIWDRD
jgi:hypothetical protein